MRLLLLLPIIVVAIFSGSPARADGITLLMTEVSTEGVVHAETHSPTGNIINASDGYLDFHDLAAGTLSISRPLAGTADPAQSTAYASAFSMTAVDLMFSINDEGMHLSGTSAVVAQATAVQGDNFVPTVADAFSAAVIYVEFRLDSPYRYSVETELVGGGTTRLFRSNDDGTGGVQQQYSGSGLLGPGRYHFISGVDASASERGDGSSEASASSRFSLSLTEASPVPLPPAAWGGLALLGLGAARRSLQRRRLT